VSALFMNEVVRLTMRSRKFVLLLIVTALFKLKPHNLLFWLVGPTLGAKYYYESHINERIENLWKVHQNRVDKGNISSKFSEPKID
jgi:hypothetical protein